MDFVTSNFTLDYSNLVQNVSDSFNSSKVTTGIPTRSGNIMARFYPIIVAEMVLSNICLILSLIVYSVLPEFRNVHGKNLITLSSCLLTTFLLLILDLILRNHISYSFCFTIAMVIHVTFLGTFFWTNIMTYDIWRTITHMKAKSEGGSHSSKYLKYSIYAWTATALISLPAAVVEMTNSIPKKYKPQFGVRRCWISNRIAFYLYFNLPVGIILFNNLVMFILTIRKLWIIKKMTSILDVKKQQQRLNLYLKLFLVMGITWIAEFLPLVTGVYYLYAVAGMLTALHGFFLFVIFICKKKILYQTWERLRYGKISQNSSSEQTSSSASKSQSTG
ncbi:G-protein coupled receptor Mth2-like [Stegodyphus dumicola]|uniref:G-protein coupled receptor Mth2-like n=1 Tax=Stegodyphus dumicola TaxID=202533 RepID=UPI0015A95ED2|nr:G-protein coupled receptor Mth2-like [Stegodyphus dumicola]